MTIGGNEAKLASMSEQAVLFLAQLLGNYGHTPHSAATDSGLSSQTIRNWLAGSKPSLPAARKLAKLFHPDDGAELLTLWGFDATAEHFRSTHDPNIANGWRLDTLIAEVRQTNTILNRIEQHLAPKPATPVSETVYNAYTTNFTYHDTDEEENDDG